MVNILSLLAIGPVIVMPPTPYDAGPLPPYRIVDYPFYDVQKECRIQGAWSCSIRPYAGSNIWTINMPITNTGGITNNDYINLLIHEFGHLRGWPANHPGGYLP